MTTSSEYALPLSEDCIRSYTLPSRYYLDPEIYELEKEKIFYKTWQYVAHVNLLPEIGDYMTLKICDQEVFVIRSDDGQIRGFYNVCQHRAHELLKGRGNVRKLIVCPYHAWSYRNDGSLAASRLTDKRPGFDSCNFSLKSVRVEIFCGCVFVNLDPEADSLISQAGDLADDITKRVPYLNDVKLCGSDMFGQTTNRAGWKVVVDNFLECYHCDPAHPDFASLIDMSAYQLKTFGLWSRQIGDRIRNRNSAYNVSPDNGNQFSIAWYLWPNTTFNILPGTREFSIFTIRPLSIDSCSFSGHNLAADGNYPEEKARYIADVLVPEDIAICESVQRGLRSRGYDQGPFIYDAEREGISEHALHHFHWLVHQALHEQNEQQSNA